MLLSRKEYQSMIGQERPARQHVSLYGGSEGLMGAPPVGFRHPLLTNMKDDIIEGQGLTMEKETLVWMKKIWEWKKGSSRN